jgi:putative membrane protein
MNQRRFKAGILILFFLILVVSCINPIYPHEMYLQHSATLVAAVFLIYSTFKNNLSNKSFVLISVFMVFHIIGARWIYSYTPYDQWIKAITGISINSCFGFERNQYDRLIHFLFGFLILIPLQELMQRKTGLTWKTSLLMAFLIILSLSMFYEVFEWMLSIVLSPEDAESYNGQQGDYWDAQKDMALAFVGSLCMIFIICILHFTRRKHKHKRFDILK